MVTDVMVRATSEPAVGAALGNAVSCNVLERLLARVLPAAGLVDSGSEPLPDLWQSLGPWLKKKKAIWVEPSQ